MKIFYIIERSPLFLKRILSYLPEDSSSVFESFQCLPVSLSCDVLILPHEDPSSKESGMTLAKKLRVRHYVGDLWVAYKHRKGGDLIDLNGDVVESFVSWNGVFLYTVDSKLAPHLSDLRKMRHDIKNRVLEICQIPMNSPSEIFASFSFCLPPSFISHIWEIYLQLQKGDINQQFYWHECLQVIEKTFPLQAQKVPSSWDIQKENQIKVSFQMEDSLVFEEIKKSLSNHDIFSFMYKENEDSCLYLCESHSLFKELRKKGKRAFLFSKQNSVDVITEQILALIISHSL